MMKSKSLKVNIRIFIDKLEKWGVVPYSLNGKK